MNHFSCPRNTPCVPLQIVRNTSLDFLIPLFWNGVPWIPHILSLYFVSELSQKSGAVSVSPDATDLCSAIRLSSFLPKQTFISAKNLFSHQLKYSPSAFFQLPITSFHCKHSQRKIARDFSFEQTNWRHYLILAACDTKPGFMIGWLNVMCAFFQLVTGRRAGRQGWDRNGQ